MPWDQTSGFNPLSETSWVVRRGFSGCNHKMEVGSPGFEKDASYHLPFCVAPARRRRLSSLGEPRKRKGWLSTHRRLFPPARNGKVHHFLPDSQRPVLGAPFPPPALQTSCFLQGQGGWGRVPSHSAVVYRKERPHVGVSSMEAPGHDL